LAPKNEEIKKPERLLANEAENVNFFTKEEGEPQGVTDDFNDTCDGMPQEF